MYFITIYQVCVVFGMLAIALTACGQAKQDVQNLPPTLAPLPQDPLLQVYFNQSLTSSYTEPYRAQTRPGDDLEKLIAEAVASAESTIDVAVQEFRLPGIARRLADRARAGIKVRLIVEHIYNRPWSDYTAQELAKLPERERDRHSEFLQLADINKDGKLSAEEIKQNDALVIVRDAGIPVIDDTADGSKGSGLMHHKFVVIDGKTVIVTSANCKDSGLKTCSSNACLARVLGQNKGFCLSRSIVNKLRKMTFFGGLLRIEIDLRSSSISKVFAQQGLQ